MNCEICTKPFNHSDRIPYKLSCPHTFCLNCVDNLKSNSCPNCNVIITIKNPNFAILNFVTKVKEEKLISIFETDKLRNFEVDIKVSEYLDYAKFYSEESRFEEAIFYFDKLIDLNPNQSDIYYEKGIFYIFCKHLAK